jgi:cell shape-determining protein MreC
MPVITGGGLIGRIMKVYNDRATIRLITDPDFSMAVKVVPGPDHPAPPPATPAPDAASIVPAATGAPATTAVPAAGASATTTPPTATTVPSTTTTAASELERGWVTGQGADKELTLEQIKAESDVKVGDIVSTSGVLESLAPADLPVGHVTAVTPRPGSGLLDVKVAPSATLSNLNLVKVLLYCTECAGKAG